MHYIPKSTTPTASPLSYTSAKLSHRSQPQDGTYQRPPAPTTPWIPCVPLPHVVTPSSEPIFAVQPQGMSRSGPAVYYPSPGFAHTPNLGPFAPSMPTVPLPHPDYHPSSSSRASHSSHSSHITSSRIKQHSLLHHDRISFLISSHPFSQNLIRVPQGADITIDAFSPPQNCIQLQVINDQAVLPLVVSSPASLSIVQILHQLHEYLHTILSRQKLSTLNTKNLATAQASFKARCASRPDIHPQGTKVLDVVGFGAQNIVFVGLKKGDEANEWIPLFRAST